MVGNLNASRSASAGYVAEDTNLLALTGQASYEWVIAPDLMRWSANAPALLGFTSAEQISTGEDYDRYVEFAPGPGRRRAILDPSGRVRPGEAVNFHFVYSVHPWPDDGAPGIWLEEIGVWYAGDDGLPKRARGVVRRIRELKRPIQRSQSGTGRDTLTGLVDRTSLQAATCEAIRLHGNDGGEASLFIIEIGRLDIINDLYGCAAGDEVMCRSAALLGTIAGEKDTLARFSGAKLGLLKPHCEAGDGYATANMILQKLQKGIRRTSFGPVSIQAWIGIARIPWEFSETNAAVAAALSACTEASRSGISAIRVFENSPENKARRYEDARLASRVIDSVGNGLLQLAFQPVVDAVSKETVFHEALARMGVCRESMVRADKFVPVAEKLGFIGSIDRFALHRAIELLEEHEEARLSINVSNETVEDAGWLSDLARLIDRRREIGSRLIVEITESRAASDLAETAKFVSIVRSLGCRVAIDDFGAGYTSFSNLKTLPVDIIKIDGSFAANIATDPHNGAFVRSLLGLARALNVKTVVEWVEDIATAETLADWGIDYLQGHCFGSASTEIPWAGKADVFRQSPNGRADDAIVAG